MRHIEPTNAAWLAAGLARMRPNGTTYRAAKDAERLARIGRALSNLAVCDCNQGLTPRQETRRASLAAEAATIAEHYTLTVETAGDPRGYVLKLHGLPSSNELGGAFGIE